MYSSFTSRYIFSASIDLQHLKALSNNVKMLSYSHVKDL